MVNRVDAELAGVRRRKFVASTGGRVAILLGVDFSGDPAVLSSQQPGASTWAMLLVGFVGLGFVGYRTSRGAASIAA